MRLLAIAGCCVVLLAAGLQAKVFISEINYHPLADGLTDGDEFEFIELHNGGAAPVSIGGWAFTNGIDYLFPSGTSLPAGGYLVVARNPTAFSGRYGTLPFGVYVGGLNNAGEKVRLSDAIGMGVDSACYSDLSPWPALADGAGHTLVRVDSTGAADPCVPASWRVSSVIGGSPGSADPPSRQECIVLVNEVLTHTDWPMVDAVELHNPGAGPAAIGGWYLTDDPAVPKKFRIADGATIAAGGYRVFYEDNDADTSNNAALPPDYFGGKFRLSTAGERILLYAADASGNLTGYAHGFSFGGMDNGISLGRYVNSIGRELFVPQTDISLGRANSGPRVGLVVISEIMYHSPAGLDYVEIHNITPEEIMLYDHDRPSNTWRLSGVGFAFPQAVRIPGNGTIVIFDDTVAAAAFRAQYAVPAEVQLFPYSGALANGGELLCVERPLEPMLKDGATIVPYQVVDQVTYSDKAPWPVAADGAGSSLQRVSVRQFGDDPANWVAASPGAGVVGVAPRRGSAMPALVGGRLTAAGVPGGVTVTGQAGVAQMVTVVVTDARGACVARRMTRADAAGAFCVTVVRTDLARGAYLAQASRSGGGATVRFLLGR